MRGSVEAAIEKPGAATLPARRLFSIIHALPSAEVLIEVDSKSVASIRCGPSFFKILGLPQEEFPPLPNFEGAKTFTLRQKDLKDGLRKTAYAISTDETRYVLNGILFSFKDNKLTLVATDGRRLALVDIELEFPAQPRGRSHPSHQGRDRTGPPRLRGRRREDERLGKPGRVRSGRHAAGLETRSRAIIPNYRQVIPPEAKERITLERESFLNTVHRVSLLSSEKSNSVKLVFSKNNIDIMANTPEVGEARESLPVAYKGREFSIAFNPEFLMAPLRNLPNDEVFLDLIDEMSPGVIKVQSPFLYVLMPMRIS